MSSAGRGALCKYLGGRSLRNSSLERAFVGIYGIPGLSLHMICRGPGIKLLLYFDLVIASHSPIFQLNNI